MKIGIFGGTFNPPHNTHIEMARQAIKQLALDKLIVMPCGDPPHKKCDIDKNVRLQLCRIAFGEFAHVDDYEIVKEGKSYTAETLAHCKKLYPHAELYLIIGGDSFENFDKWYCPDEIARLCTLAVVGRDNVVSHETEENIKRKFGARVIILQFQPTTLSSTEIRLRYEFGFDNSGLVPDSVDEYISQHGLYKQYRAMALAVQKYLTSERFSHTFFVVKRGLELASDELRHKAFVACLLHDVAKYIPKSQYGKYNFTQNDLPDSVVHSFLGAEVARADFGIEDEEILDAIRFHTTGCPNMSDLAKIVYVADKTEDSRPYPKQHLKCGTLDEQFVACLKEAYEVCLQRHCDSVCPLSELTIRKYCPEYFGLKPLA